MHGHCTRHDQQTVCACADLNGLAAKGRAGSSSSSCSHPAGAAAAAASGRLGLCWRRRYFSYLAFPCAFMFVSEEVQLI